MTETEFTVKLNSFLLSCGISQERRGYWSFIRISYRKYKNPNMKIADEGVMKNFKPFYKILASLRLSGKYDEYFELLTNK